MKKDEYWSINKLKEFLKLDKVKNYIENNDFINLFMYAYAFSESLIHDLILLFLKLQNTYTPNCWVIVKFNNDWWFANYKGVGYINLKAAQFYSSFEDAETRVSELNQRYNYEYEYRVLGLKGEL